MALVVLAAGAAPGAEAEVSWREFLLYVESEYGIEFEGGEGNFLYTWIEATAWQDWWRGVTPGHRPFDR